MFLKLFKNLEGLDSCVLGVKGVEIWERLDVESIRNFSAEVVGKGGYLEFFDFFSLVNRWFLGLIKVFILKNNMENN